jgi:hypothetical protein
VPNGLIFSNSSGREYLRKLSLSVVYILSIFIRLLFIYIIIADLHKPHFFFVQELRRLVYLREFRPLAVFFRYGKRLSYDRRYPLVKMLSRFYYCFDTPTIYVSLLYPGTKKMHVHECEKYFKYGKKLLAGINKNTMFVGIILDQVEEALSIKLTV